MGIATPLFLPASQLFTADVTKTLLGGLMKSPIYHRSVVGLVKSFIKSSYEHLLETEAECR